MQNEWVIDIPNGAVQLRVMRIAEKQYIGVMSIFSFDGSGMGNDLITSPYRTSRSAKAEITRLAVEYTGREKQIQTNPPKITWKHVSNDGDMQAEACRGNILCIANLYSDSQTELLRIWFDPKRPDWFRDVEIGEHASMARLKDSVSAAIAEQFI